jgi:hypothetical protein
MGMHILSVVAAKDCHNMLRRTKMFIAVRTDKKQKNSCPEDFDIGIAEGGARTLDLEVISLLL